MNTACVVPVLGSVTWTSATEIAGGASCTVAVPVAVARVPMLGLESCSAKLSLLSARLSALTATLTVLLVSPAAKVSVPEVAA